MKNLIKFLIALIIIGAGVLFYNFTAGQPQISQEIDADDMEMITAMRLPHEEGENAFMENFKTLDIYGNEVGNEIFANYHLTKVYVWGTF